MVIMESLNTYFIYGGNTFQGFMCGPIYCLFYFPLLSLYFLHSCETNICTVVIVCHPLTDILPRNKQKMPLEIS